MCYTWNDSENESVLYFLVRLVCRTFTVEMDLRIVFTFEELVYDEEQGSSIIQCSTNILFFSHANGSVIQSVAICKV